MGLRKYLKGALCGIVSGLAGCMPRFAEPNMKQAVLNEQELEKHVESVPAEPRKLKKWQYPVNILGGYLTHIFVHESGHAVVGLLQGREIKEFRIYPGYMKYGDYTEFHGGFVTWKPGDYNELSSQQYALRDIAGPLSDVTLAEIINYNLRKGKISEKYQPFWATTSLMARAGPVLIAIESLNGNTRLNDFKGFEKNTGVPKEAMAGLVGLYTALSYKRIKKEFRVALGKELYDYKPKKGELNLFPTNDGISLTYSLNF